MKTNTLKHNLRIYSPLTPPHIPFPVIKLMHRHYCHQQWQQRLERLFKMQRY